MNDKIFNIIVPKEKKIKIKDGKRITIEEKIYPGYVLVEMLMGPDSWYAVRNTPRVTVFVGSDTTDPTPLSKEEVDGLMARMTKEEPKYNIVVKVGEGVRIIDGPFKDYDGKVAEIDEAKDRGGDIVPVVLTIYEDRSFTFILKTPPASDLLRKAAGVEKGAANPLTGKVGKITKADLRKIAERKMVDLNANDIEAAEKIIAGTARSMGIEII